MHPGRGPQCNGRHRNEVLIVEIPSEIARRFELQATIIDHLPTQAVPVGAESEDRLDRMSAVRQFTP
jgi:hypothetical protein